MIVRGRPRVKAIDERMDELNKSIKTFGLNHTVRYNAEIATGEITSSKELTQEDKKKIIEIATKEFEKKLTDVVITLK